VDGEMIYVYGEGWDFGEVAGNARGKNATQINMSGTGIGTFNDRGRDAVRGGTPFSSKTDQGYATGMYFDPNETNTLSQAEQLNTLLIQKDQLRVTLAGNLANYEFIGAEGALIAGSDVPYGGSPAGYTSKPEENIIYVSAHDNETLFDAIQYKMPNTTSLEARVLAQSLSLSLVAFSQGVPFFHAGSEILRSKSMDRDSYDSTDWFNALDWTYNYNGWGHGLPLRDKNGNEWPLIQPLLANPEIAPSQTEMLQTLDLFQQWVSIRRSSPLFRLQTAQQIKDLVRFHNTGPDQIPGLIAMSISDHATQPIDPNYGVIIVLWNASPETTQFTIENVELGNLELHPRLLDTHNSQASYTQSSQEFSLPGRSVAVFIGDTPLKSFESETLPEQDLNKKTPEATVEPVPTVISATETQEQSPSTSEPVKDEVDLPIDNPSNLWAYLVGGFLAIAAGVGGWFYLRRRQ
jgi:pullulanase-type alpha-1,6-glucosidase